MRLFLLRILLSWWMIPASWLTIFPLIYLLSGDTNDAKYEVMQFCKYIWHGEE